MNKKEFYLGRAKRVVIDTTDDRQFVRFHLELPESPQNSPIEFVLSAPLSMQILATLSELQKKNDWKMPKSVIQ